MHACVAVVVVVFVFCDGVFGQKITSKGRNNAAGNGEDQRSTRERGAAGMKRTQGKLLGGGEEKQSCRPHDMDTRCARETADGGRRENGGDDKQKLPARAVLQLAHHSATQKVHSNGGNGDDDT